MFVIFFDLGAVCLAFFIFIICGMSVVSEISMWIQENFWVVVLILIIFAIVKAVFLSVTMKKKIYAGILCGLVDSVRMIPAIIYLDGMFGSFAELGSDFFEFVLGFVSTIFGACIIGIPMIGLIGVTEGLCMMAMADENDSWIWLYLLIAIVGTGLQFLVLSLFGAF